MIKVLYAASEAAPFIKTGGLGDVAGSLPLELQKQNVDIRVVLPKYSSISSRYKDKMQHLCHTQIGLAWRRKYLGINKLVHNGITFYFIDNEDYFKRNNCYGFDDDAERFAFFSRAILEMLPLIDFYPDVINLNDWQTALVSVFLKLQYRQKTHYENIKTVFTIHNLKYQGIFDANITTDILSLDRHFYDNGDLEFYGAVNFMKAGLLYADFLTTVSHSYANEIQNPYFGEKLDGILRMRSNELTGIVNGIDYREYNPRTDRYLSVNYDIYNALAGKAENKINLQKRLGLPLSRSAPILSIVSRLVETKGIDLIIRIIDELLKFEDIQLVILGTGDYAYEEWFKGLQWRFPKKVSANITFSNEMAHMIYAASSLFLMPSRYEPCGIGQLIALRYGAIPVVHAVGGLHDTVYPYDSFSNHGNGYTFCSYNAHDFLFAIKRALETCTDISLHKKIVENAMKADYSWSESAKQYKRLYTDLAKNKEI